MRWAWRFLGLVVVLVGAALVFVTADVRFGREVAWVLVAGVGLVLPAILARLLLRAFRRMDADAGLLESTAGLMVVCALGAMLVLGLGFRGALSRALEGVPDRYRRVPPPAAKLARKVGRWIMPAPPDRHARATPAARGKGPPPPPPPSPPVAADDAGAARPGEPDAGAPAHPVIPTIPEPEGLTAETVRVCDEGAEVSAFWAVDLGGPRRAEIVVLCEKDYYPTDVRVLWLADDGRLRERTRITPRAPPDLTLNLAHPRVVDLDEDGSADLLLCAFYTNSRGGPRGGDTWWSRGVPGGGPFLPPTRLVGTTCAAIDAGDIDGDGHLELVVVHFGNPWFEARPEGEVRWFERTNRQFSLRGREPVLPWPDGLALADVDGDGKLDAIVHHEDGRGAVVLPGTARGLDPIDPSLQGGVPEPPRMLTVRLDRDATDDRIEAIVGGSLQLSRSEPPGPAGDTAVRAPDFREHVVGALPAAPD